ncbi:site-specific DNA-methyltransferase [Flavobacterium celericrescens]|uniref:site-specific DNA-methyltransferase (adenine-specific) n=1 Tax=Flavobacterium celericrescens TaxID=2709780 RepID=A0ABX0I8Z4_9FLAO|nr:site-specific DNA-methyltransferase [Flavobacterium celericrescens]NHM03606.1 site-specific DNA-methyltransferase [Flavobacterium celericrescens]
MEVEKVNLKSLEITEDLKKQLKAIMPQVFSEDKIDFEKLKLTLGEDVSDSEERFGLQWPGKKDCFKVIQEPSIGTLKPCKEESVNWDTTENIFIEGDNLEVLKLLQKSYYGKIKMIYIDPPYNTGGEFIYPDRFQENLNTYLAYTGQVNEEGIKFSTNSETTGRYHSNWANMMYSRLFLARNLLKKDGIICISIDDNEIHNLRSICNEIFGEENYLQEIIWKRHGGGGNDSKYFAIDHEYILCYAKNLNYIDKLRLPLDDDDLKKYKYRDEHFNELGAYQTKSFLRMRPDDPRPGLQYEIDCPDGTKLFDEWKWEQNSFLKALSENKVLIEKDTKGNWKVEYKIYAKDKDGDEKMKVPRSMIINEATNSKGKALLTNTLGTANLFNNPKPIELLKHLMSFATSDNDNDIILDFFGGSCSTAHAVLDLNHITNGNRKFIMIQLPELCNEKSEAFKKGYKTIADIGRDRIKKALNYYRNTIESKKQEEINKIKFEVESNDTNLDLGFKSFKLDKSNFKIWDGNTENMKLENELENGLFHIDLNSSKEDILTELILKSGFKLSVKIDLLKLANKDVYSIENNSLLICLDDSLNVEVIKEIAKLDPARVIVLDSGFNQKDDLKTNAVQILKSHNIEDFRTV